MDPIEQPPSFAARTRGRSLARSIVRIALSLCVTAVALEATTRIYFANQIGSSTRD